MYIVYSKFLKAFVKWVEFMDREMMSAATKEEADQYLTLYAIYDKFPFIKDEDCCDDYEIIKI